MFPQCANPECSAIFGSFREGTFFRFRRTSSEEKAPANSHLVEHAWLCEACSEKFTLEYRHNRITLASLTPAMPLLEAPSAPEPVRARARTTRATRRRRRSRRTSAQPPGNNPLIVLAIGPRGDFPD